MGIKSALNLGFETGTKLARNLAEKSFCLCELLGGGGGEGLKFNAKSNVKFSTKFKLLNWH